MENILIELISFWEVNLSLLEYVIKYLILLIIGSFQLQFVILKIASKLVGLFNQYWFLSYHTVRKLELRKWKVFFRISPPKLDQRTQIS